MFYTTDERTNRTGNLKFEADSYQLGKSLGDPFGINSLAVSSYENGLKRSAYSAKIPRFVELIFNQAIIPTADSKQFNTPTEVKEILSKLNELENSSEFLNSEENVSSIKDVVIAKKDFYVKNRLINKLQLLMQLNDLKELPPAESVIKAQLECSSLCISLLGMNNQDGLDVVDSNNEIYVSDILTQASKAVYELLLDASKADELLFSLEERTNFFKLQKLELIQSLQSSNLASINESDSSNDKPFLNCIAVEPAQTNDHSSVYGAKILGYLVFKRETTYDGKQLPIKFEYLNASNSDGINLNFIDSKIVYGSTYEYSIRTLILIRTLHQSDGNDGLEPGRYFTYSMLASKECKPVLIKAEEKIPPKEPDGIFYDFMYSMEQGLKIRWQMPVGTQRDVKYFQIFRRKNVDQPFTCIAELDFDDSEVKSMKTELVQLDRVYRFSKPVLQFVDAEFTRGSKFIYALAAVDAHGMTSGYSEQMEISFDRVSNKISLNSVSRAGAPKQYPNFYLRPNLADGTRTSSLTQDAMMVSGCKKMTVYYDPDARYFESTNGSKGQLIGIQSDSFEYKFHILNLDRQKDDILKIKIQ
jgi:hypothetical protein